MDQELVAENLDNEEFFFESDHLALRGNSDYTSILRAVAVLQAQKIQAARDIEKIAAAEKQALSDPEEFLRNLTSGTIEEMPGPISIIELPKINFEKYNVTVPEYLTEESNPIDNNDKTVRGRSFDQTKPETFNRLWSCEEQLRLEELLIEYPPEPIEMRRFAKIARALGNRTTKQVASRVQKFFQKLHSAGMPVPGRIPKANRQYISKANRMIKQALRPTTFFPANYVPVTIAADDDDLNADENAVCLDSTSYRQAWMNKTLNQDGDGLSGHRTVIVDDESDAEDGGGDVKVKDLIIKIIQRIKRDKEADMPIERQPSIHNGFKCDFCSEEPIIGTRWHCKTCPDNSSVDFCTDCLVSQLHSQQPHPFKHKITGYRIIIDQEQSAVQSEAESEDDDNDNDDDDDADADADIGSDDDHNRVGPSDIHFDNTCDKDYLKNCSYNYLDPNFLPQ